MDLESIVRTLVREAVSDILSDTVKEQVVVELEKGFTDKSQKTPKKRAPKKEEEESVEEVLAHFKKQETPLAPKAIGKAKPVVPKVEPVFPKVEPVVPKVDDAKDRDVFSKEILRLCGLTGAIKARAKEYLKSKGTYLSKLPSEDIVELLQILNSLAEKEVI